MPYRRLPKSDAARLKALRTLLDNNEIYIARNRFIDWKMLNEAQVLYDRLLTATEQLRLSRLALKRYNARMAKLHHNAWMYVSHFIQVLLMTVERGEIKRSLLELYGLSQEATAVPDISTAGKLMEWGRKIVEGEKLRLKRGGRPIYNPSLGMLNTHYDIFVEAVGQQQSLQERCQKDSADVQALRPRVDEVILDLWNQVEKHYENEPPETRFKACRKFGIVYYYRRHEEHNY